MGMRAGIPAPAGTGPEAGGGTEKYGDGFARPCGPVPALNP